MVVEESVEVETSNVIVDMIFDAAGSSFDWTADEPPNQQAQDFYNVMKAADEPLWDGCDKEHTVLACVTELLSIKADCGITKEIVNKRMQDMLHKAQLATKKAYGDNMQEWKEHSAPHPHDWISSANWPGVVDHWCSDAFASRSARNKANRAAVEGSGTTTGSVSMLVHKQRFEKENQREPRWSDELFAPTHKSMKTGQFVSAKAQKAFENYENAMRLSHGANKNDWPAFDINVWYTSAVDDRNAHGDNYGLGALGQTRAMYRVGGSSSTPSRSSAPPALPLTQDDIEAISSYVMTSIMPKLTDRITDTIMPKLTDTITDQINRTFRSAQGGSTSDHASMLHPQDDDDDGEDDDEDLGRDDTS